MATLDHPSEFVISADADKLLNALSSEFSDLVLEIASANAATSNSGERVITSAGIKSVIGSICEVLSRGIESGHAPQELAKHVQQLRAIYAGIDAERK